MSMFGLPMGAQMAPDALGMTQTPTPQPFVWGAGGAQLTPDQLEAKQRIAAQLSQSNYSPVSSVWQGLGRVVDNVRGALQTKSLDKQQAAMGADQQRIIAALTGGDQSATAAAISSGDPALAQFGLKAYELAHKPAPAPSDFERRLIAGGIQPGTPQWAQMNLGAAQNIADPTVTIPLPGGQTYVGPRSGMQAALGGGGPVSSPSGGGVQPPSTLPPDFDFGGPTQNASGGFR